MTSNPGPDDVAAYAAAVRTAVGDLPPDEKAALLEDLEDHLAEIAAEAEGTLADRLGAPEHYAAELRAAYGAAHSPPASRRSRDREAVRAVITSLERQRWYREVRSFLPSLRPAWWVFRGYIVVLILTAVFSSGNNIGPIPNPFSGQGLLQLIVTTAAIVVSVRLGRRGRSRREGLRLLGLLGNTAIALLAIPMLGSMSNYPVAGSVPAPETGVSVPGAYAGGMTTNVYPYSRDGKPLKDVLLYDQDGRPLAVDGKSNGLATTYPIGADGQPITNAYPLDQRNPDGSAVVAPRVAIPPWPTPAPTPSARATP